MRTTCPNCNNALTIREVIRSSCSKCASTERADHAGAGKSPSVTSIKTNFDALIAAELKKRSLKSAA